MHESYKQWLDSGCPKVYCNCPCHGEITIKEHHKRFGIPKYIKGHGKKDKHYVIHESYQKWLDNGKPIVYCECPCHGEIIVRDFYSWKGIPKYINHHHPPWNKGKIDVYSNETLEKMRKPKTEEHKQKISNAKIGIPSSNKGKHPSEETKQKMRDNHWDCSGENNPNYNREFSDEHRKRISENHADFSKEKHPNWKGGISKSPYCEKWTEELREEIRNRDGRICQECGKTEIENKRKLTCHHIHYDKESCYPDLITLCVSCNSKVNFNRDYWEEHFMKKLKERKLLNYFGKKEY